MQIACILFTNWRLRRTRKNASISASLLCFVSNRHIYTQHVSFDGTSKTFIYFNQQFFLYSSFSASIFCSHFFFSHHSEIIIFFCHDVDAPTYCWRRFFPRHFSLNSKEKTVISSLYFAFRPVFSMSCLLLKRAAPFSFICFFFRNRADTNVQYNLQHTRKKISLVVGSFLMVPLHFDDYE